MHLFNITSLFTRFNERLLQEQQKTAPTTKPIISIKKQG